MALIGSLAVNIVARTDKLTKGLRKADSSIGRFTRSVGAATVKMAKYGAAITAAGVGLASVFVRQQFQAVDALTKVSDRLGIATEALSGLHHAAELSGVSTRTLDMALQRMIRRVSEASQGTGEAVNAIQELGLSAQQLNMLAPDQQFIAVAEALNKVNNQSDRVRLAFKLFDSEGVGLLQLTQQGSEGIRAMIAEAERLGITFDRAAADKIIKANDAVTRMKAAFGGVARTVAIEIAPSIERMANNIADSVSGTGAFGQSLRKIANVFRTIHNLFDSLRILAKKLQIGFSEMVAIIASAIDRLTTRVAELLDKIPGVEATASPGARILAEELRSSNERLTKDITRIQEQMTRRNMEFARDQLRPITQDTDAASQVTAAVGVDRLAQAFQQFSQFARFGRQLGFQAQATGGVGVNAALEQGTREAFVAARSGRRREFMKEIANHQKEEVNISKSIKKGIDTLIEQGRSTLSSFSIPPA